MTKILRPLAVLAAALVALPACDQAELQTTFEAAAYAPPSGITRTTEGGVVTDRDDSDWRVAPLYATRISVQPFYPNPLPRTGLGRLSITIFESDGVPTRFTVYRVAPGGTPVLLDSRQALVPGINELSVAPAQLGSLGLHRLVVTDAVGRLVTYGDVEVQ